MGLFIYLLCIMNTCPYCLLSVRVDFVANEFLHWGVIKMPNVICGDID